MGDVTPLPVQPAPGRGPRFGWWLVAAAAGGVAIVGSALALLLTFGRDEAPAADPAVVEAGVAETACRGKLLDSLKAPSTATITLTKSDQVGGTQPNGARAWVLSGTVDSENSFGAMLRDTWECQAVVNGGKATATWTAFGKDEWSIDESNALLKCQEQLRTAYPDPVTKFTSEVIFAEGTEWRITGTAWFAEPGAYAEWRCEVTVDETAAGDDRVLVGYYGDDE